MLRNYISGGVYSYGAVIVPKKSMAIFLSTINLRISAMKNLSADGGHYQRKFVSVLLYRWALTIPWLTRRSRQWRSCHWREGADFVPRKPVGQRLSSPTKDLLRRGGRWAAHASAIYAAR